MGKSKPQPRNPLASALHYAVHREVGLRIFLDDSEVSIDTHHLERNLRAIPTGRRNWLFAWTELVAQRIGIIQSLLVTCRPQGVDPLHLPRRCPATHRRASGQSRHRTHPEGVEDDVRQPPLAL